MKHKKPQRNELIWLQIRDKKAFNTKGDPPQHYTNQLILRIALIIKKNQTFKGFPQTKHIMLLSIEFHKKLHTIFRWPIHS